MLFNLQHVLAVMCLCKQQPACIDLAHGSSTMPCYALQIFDLPSAELVPGDLVELNVGDRVPADIRIIALKTPTLRSEQASLTGESAPANKELSAVDATNCDLLSKHNMLFAGTAVANGHCLGVVNNIGMTTEIGKIQQSIHDAAGEEEDTPLKKKLDHFGELLAQVTIVCFSVSY